MLAQDELLARLAATFRRDVGPQVTDPFAKTQAFMAAVVLEKLSAQLSTAAADAEADAADLASLIADLTTACTQAPLALATALASLAAQPSQAALAAFVQALYGGQTELGAERFERLRTRVRQTLRARLDRQLRYAA